MNRHVQLGCCGALAVFVLLAGLFILETSNFIESRSSAANQMLVEEERIRVFEAAWQPPAAALGTSWFPAEWKGWKRERTDAQRTIPDLGVERTGPQATYRSTFGTIRVNIIAATEIERVAIVAQALSTLESRRSRAREAAGGMEDEENRNPRCRTTTQGNRTHIQVGANSHTRFWWIEGWLFIFRARGAADSEEFPEAFLRALTPPGAAEAGGKTEQN